MLEFQSGSKRIGPLAAIIHVQLRPMPISKQVNISPILDRRKVFDPLNHAKLQKRTIGAASDAINRPAHPP